MFQLFSGSKYIRFFYYSKTKEEMRTMLLLFGEFYDEFYIEQSWEIYLSKPHKGSV